MTTTNQTQLKSLQTKREGLVERYYRKLNLISEIKREYYLRPGKNAPIDESDVAEELANARTVKAKVDADIEAIDAQIEALQTEATQTPETTELKPVWVYRQDTATMLFINLDTSNATRKELIAALKEARNASYTDIKLNLSNELLKSEIDQLQFIHR